MEDEHAAPAFTGFAEATKGLFHIKAVPVGTVIPLTDILGMDPGENNIAATSDGKAVSKEEFTRGENLARQRRPTSRITGG